MSDVFSSPEGQRLLAADPAEVSALAGMFGTVAQQAGSAKTGLQGAQHDATWTGQAADAFRAQLGRLPDDLAKVERSYQDVSNALHAYEVELAPIHSQFQQLASQYQGLQGSLSTAQGTLATAQGNYYAASKAPGAKSTSPSVVNAHGALQAASGAVTRLQGEISGLNDRGARLLSELDAARGRAVGAVQRGAGVAPSQSFWSSLWHDVSNFVAGVAVNIGKSVWDLVSGHAIINFIEHPGWASLGELVKDIAVTASLVAMVAAPFAAPELAAADGAALAGEEVAEGAGEELAGDAFAGATEEGAGDSSATFGSAMRGVNTWGNRVALGANVGQMGIDGGEGHWGAAALDAGFLIAPNLVGGLPKSFGAIRGSGDVLANVLHVGDRQAESALGVVRELNAPETMRYMRTYEAARVFGASQQEALGAFENGLPAAFRSINLDSPTEIKSAVDAANANVVRTGNLAMRVGKPVAYGADAMIDGGADKVKHRYHLVPDDG